MLLAKNRDRFEEKRRKSKIHFLQHIFSNSALSLFFYKSYELVQFIKRKIDGAIGPLVDRRMESGMHEEGDGHTLVAQITEEIFSSPE